jgi:hypothetical protein
MFRFGRVDDVSMEFRAGDPRPQRRCGFGLAWTHGVGSNLETFRGGKYGMQMAYGQTQLLNGWSHVNRVVSSSLRDGYR